MKIVINTYYGGFGLSEKAMRRYAELKGLTLYPDTGKFVTTYWLVPPGDREDQASFYAMTPEEAQASNKRYGEQTLNDHDIERNDPLLVQVVEELGADAADRCGQLTVVEIPDDVLWDIAEYDGLEHVAEKHRTWG
jgi:hypothetical protein